MTGRRGRRGLGAAAAAATTALALAGCSASYVGEDWQCPLAQGSVCASVAVADPAVPEASAPDAPTPRMPRPPARDMTGDGAAVAGAPDCASGCNPLAWLAGLFGASDDADGAGERVDDAISSPEPVSPATGTGTAELEMGGTLPIPDEEVPAPDDAAVAADEALRAPETVARVWIAPWVDADGIYREGAWVRAVIAPAEWRLR